MSTIRHHRPIIAIVIAAQVVVACASGAPPTRAPAATAGSSLATSPAVASPPAAPPTASPIPSASADPDPYAGIAVETIDAEIITLPGGDVGYLGTSASFVWAATIDGLARINPKTLRAELIDHGAHFGLAVSRTAVWTTDGGAERVMRFDPKTGRQTVVLDLIGYPESVAILGDSVWVAQHRRGSVTRYREPSGALVALIDVGPGGRGGPHGITATESGVWVGITNSQSVVRIDPSTNAVVASIKTATSPCAGIAVQPDDVWVSSCYDDHFAIHIDPRSNTNVAEIDIGGNNGGAVIVGGRAWFPVGNRLVRIDPATNRIDRIVQFTSREFDGYGTTIGFGFLWVGGLNGLAARIPLAALDD